LPPNTRTTEALRHARRISEAQIEAAVSAAITGWSRRPFPFNAHYALDLATLLVTEADAVSAMASDAFDEDERRVRLRAAILRAVPTRVTT
jgi:hypothetical protein